MKKKYTFSERVFGEATGNDDEILKGVDAIM